MWEKDTKTLAVRISTGGKKAYIFQSRFNKKSLRITIGDIRTWSIDRARGEARRLQSLIDQKQDPRQVAAASIVAAEETRDTVAAEARRQVVTVADAWDAYIAHQKDKMTRKHIEQGKRWGARHLADHENLAQVGGEKKKRGNGLTKPGVLYPLLQMRMADVTATALKEWQKVEAETRANNARQGFEMFRAFWRWCASHPEYAAVIDAQAVESKELRDEVPSRKSKRFDVLQRAHLPAWFAAVRGLGNPVISAYLQGLLLTGARREELAGLRWQDVDFQWGSIWVKDKIAEEGRKIPLSPYLYSLLAGLPRRNEWVFSSPAAKNGRLAEPRIPHNRALSIAGLEQVTLHGLRRTFASLAEWVEIPAGVVAQIMGHKPSATAEKHYIDRPLELLASWHSKYEKWILEQAGIEQPTAEQPGLRVVK